jgi:hypothetical protein
LTHASRVVALRVDSVAHGAVLSNAVPDDDEVAVGVGRHRGLRLLVRGERVDSEFRTERLGRQVQWVRIPLRVQAGE